MVRIRHSNRCALPCAFAFREAREGGHTRVFFCFGWRIMVFFSFKIVQPTAAGESAAATGQPATPVTRPSTADRWLKKTVISLQVGIDQRPRCSPSVSQN